MARFTHEVHRKQTFILLFAYVFVSVCAFSLGALAMQTCRGQVLPLIRSLPSVRPNGAVVAISVLFPLAVTYFAIQWNNRYILWLLLFIKTSMFAFLSYGVFEAFPHSGWLLRVLVLFSDHLSIIACHWLWLRGLVFRDLSGNRELFTCGIVLFLVLTLDFVVICPFTAMLFIHK